MQNAGMAALGLDWRYLAFEVRPAELRQALEGAKAMRFLGLNLTVPHKLLALEWVDVLDDSARSWGAVNTIRFEARAADGSWRPLGEIPAEEAAEVRSQGFNTDADAVVRSIQEDLEIRLAGMNIVLLGAGGAGRVAALKLAAEGAGRLNLVNRTREKAEAIGREIQERYPQVGVEIGYPAGAADLVVNATSLGLKETDARPWDEDALPLRRCGAAYDMIYRPAETAFLRAARTAGCKTANGIGMLLYQGAKALEIWSGQTAPVAVMREALRQNVYGTR